MKDSIKREQNEFYSLCRTMAHPFMQGNGRSTRLLTTNKPVKRGHCDACKNYAEHEVFRMTIQQED